MLSEQARFERRAQTRVIDLFADKAWADLLRDNLTVWGYSAAHIFAALQKLETAAEATGITLYQANLHTYQLLCCGVTIPRVWSKPHDGRSGYYYLNCDTIICYHSANEAKAPAHP
jgi:type I restriction enzyme R subunit